MVTSLFLIERLRFVETVNASIEYYGCFMMIAAMVTAIGMKLEKPFLRLLLCAFASTFVCLFFDALATTIYGLNETPLPILIKVFRCLSLLGATASTFFYSCYVIASLEGENEGFARAIKIILLLLSSIMSILLISSIWTNYIFGANEVGQPIKGEGYFLFGVYCLIGFAINIVYLLYKASKGERRGLLVFGLYLVIPILGASLAFFIPSFAIFEICMLFLMFLVLFRAQMQYVNRIVMQQKKIAEQEIELARMRESVLLSQVKPHFIYNALTAMKVIEGNPPETVKAIDDFATYLRSHLSTDDRPTIPFVEELEHVKTYLSIEQLRFGDELKVEFDIQDKDFFVPSLAVQMLVENAVKHGISVKRGGGHVKISSFNEEEFYIVTVEDDGVGFDTGLDYSSGHVGLKNVEARLALYLHGSLSIGSVLGQGSKATIKIPSK